ncbi:flagellar hook-associated protein FlgK [Ancylobacter polymorphus]|uniref:Flagellar hook-associated protein 1 n=1 Tax=Ancylobacter polymorphus TaxID=223390 RepID=A0A9E7CXS8_9HYPH|nr:flagellar hook-associated protein FlgK [Ancylobacter polymorphus]UOK72729.1 flagellar hook-associated protein FlgK [Ancylobacter polymorphus]
MSLSLAFNTARASLAATSTQIETTTRNIANAGQPGSSRKIAVTTTEATGGAYVVTVSRASDGPLYTRMLGATSNAADRQAVLDGLDRLRTGMGDVTGDNSPAARLGALGDALAQFANAPDDPALGARTVTMAQDLATTLNSAAATVRTVRSEADSGMARSVARVNDLLKQFAAENDTVVRGTGAGRDVSDAMDRRDTLLASLAEEMGVTAVSRGNNDLVLYTDGGATLFETTPRTVSFATTPVLAAGMAGKAVMVDGVSVTGADATMPLRSGRIAGLAELRDRTAVTLETQLDSLAFGLTQAFAEKDQTGGGAPDAPGLFTDGTANLPAGPTGLAARLTVNPAVDPAQGGSPSRLRDGGINGAAYVVNTGGQPSFGAHLQAGAAALAEVRDFDPASGIPARSTMADFAAASTGWLEGQRQVAARETESETALLAHASSALSNATGINMDDEYARQLDLERSYQASSKLIAVVSSLYDALFQALR